MRTYFILLLVITTFCGCQRLDPMMFNNDNTITEYKRDQFIKDVDFILDDSYTIPNNLITEIILESKTEKEKTPTKIYATYIGDLSKISIDTVIMYCHGNKWHMDFYWQRAKLLANVGGKNRFGVMMVDYRGYGLSEGKPTEDGMYADVDACLKWLKQKGLSSNRLVIYGFSLGSAPSCELTAHPRSLTPTKLILEAPFASSDVLVQDASKLALSPKFLADTKIDNAEEIKNVKQDLFWIHGIADDYLSYKTHGQIIYNNYRGSYKEAHLVDGAGHGSVPNTFGFENYKKALEKFIRR